MSNSGRSGVHRFVREPDVTVHTVSEDGPYPNNEGRPVVLYRHAFESTASDLSTVVRTVFREHNWSRAWQNGIFSYHHYHSTAHEVLGVVRGTVTVQLGGPNGERFDLGVGDVVVLPAGVAHKNCGSSRDFQVVGAYPENGSDWDLLTGAPDERPDADRRIREVPLPSCDPVYGSDGPLIEHW